MKSLRKRIQILKQRVIALADILKALPDLNCPSDFDVTGDGLTKQWVAYELALTLGLLSEADLTYRTIWSNDAEWSASQLHIASVSADNLLSKLKDDIINQIDRQIADLRQVLSEPSDSDILLEIILSVQELVLAFSALDIEDLLLSSKILLFLVDLVDSREKLDNTAGRALRSKVNSFLSESWIYPWVYDHKENPCQIEYRALFSFARFDPRELTMNLFEGLSVTLRSIAGKKEIVDTIHLALERVAELIAQDSLDGLFDILSANGSPFGGVNPNAKSLINVIPGSGDDQCRPILFAFAKTGGGKSRFSTPAIMRQVREHLIHCQNRVMVVILIAPLDGLSDSLEDSIGDIGAHMNNGKGPLQLFIPLAVFNNKISLINWR